MPFGLLDTYCFSLFLKVFILFNNFSSVFVSQPILNEFKTYVLTFVTIYSETIPSLCFSAACSLGQTQTETPLSS